MASLRSQVFDKAYAKQAKLAKKTGARLSQKGMFKGSGRDAAYRGAAGTVMRKTGNSAAANKAGNAASKKAASQGGS